ncbi:plasmid replication protein RepC [Pseudooceanicola nitratireducens]|uniref:plasmid replication protein RepC n=1 Tax=Pseudooceanicola nitratireducens TaxID=517719 RepID=UPI003341D445
MRTVTTTPFGARPVTACLMENQARGRAPAQISSVDKYQVLNAVGLIARDLGLSDRNIAVLQVLLSFHPDRDLKDGAAMVVFASNASLSERAHGMPESTLRRHLSALVQAGLILRHDSPNGKRYARRGAGGQITRAFGFDLTPLLTRAPEILERANIEIARREQIKALREEVSLMLRDASKLIEYALHSGIETNLDEVDDRTRLARQVLRRKLSYHQLREMRDQMEILINDIHARLGTQITTDPEAENTVDIYVKTETKTAKLSGNPAQNERHYQRSDKDILDKKVPDLGMVLTSCPDVTAYFGRPVRDWSDYLYAICSVAPMVGIDAQNWAKACQSMGPENAAATVAVLVQKISEIANPGAYFRTLAQKAGEGDFSPLPLLTALARKAA